MLDWVHSVGIDCYGLSSITPMGRSDLADEHNILLKTETDMTKCAETISIINEKYGEGFLYQVKDGDPNLSNCGAFTSNPSITPSGNIKFCAMDDETIIKSFGNVFIVLLKGVLRESPASRRGCSFQDFCKSMSMKNIISKN